MARTCLAGVVLELGAIALCLSYSVQAPTIAIVVCHGRAGGGALLRQLKLDQQLCRLWEGTICADASKRFETTVSFA